MEGVGNSNCAPHRVKGEGGRRCDGTRDLLQLQPSVARTLRPPHTAARLALRERLLDRVRVGVAVVARVRVLVCDGVRVPVREGLGAT